MAVRWTTKKEKERYGAFGEMKNVKTISKKTSGLLDKSSVTASTGRSDEKMLNRKHETIFVLKCKGAGRESEWTERSLGGTRSPEASEWASVVFSVAFSDSSPCVGETCEKETAAANRLAVRKVIRRILFAVFIVMLPAANVRKISCRNSS